MNIKVRLSLQFTFIVTGILLFFSLLVYYFSYSRQIAKFKNNILDSAKNYATLFINVAEVDSLLLKKIQESTIPWEREELAITDSVYNILYSNNIEYLSDTEILVKNAYRNSHYFSVADKEGVFYRHSFENRSYYVFALAYDKTRSAYLKELRKILFWSILFSIWLSILLSYLFARRAIRPISQIIKSVKEINSLRLNRRLDEGDRRDEIDQLSVTFNEMLSDLEIAFKNQEDFVSNASHELRTPLTVMISESDYFLSRERNLKEYINHINGLVRDLKKLNVLINNLLELAQINRDRKIVFSDVRIDEIVFNAIHKIKDNYHDRKIVPKIRIYKTFTRASNVKFIGGFGIGLSLVSKVMELHEAEIIINSKVNEGTHIEIRFRKSTV